MTLVDLAELLWLLLSALGLALAMSYARVPVLGQGAFMAVGAFGTALLGPAGQGWPLGIACATSVLLAAAIGYLLAMGASKLEGATLALATWALAWLVDRLLRAYPDLFGGREGLTVPGPTRVSSPNLGAELLLTPAAHVGIAALLCLLALVALARLGRGPGGLDLAAVREDPRLATSLGLDVGSRRRTVLAVTAAVGALSGAGSTLLHGLVAPADVSPLVSLQLFVAVLLGGTARWWGPVLGVGVLALVTPSADALASAGGLDAERFRAVLSALLLVAVVALRDPLAARFRRPGRPPGPPLPAPSVPSRVLGDVVLEAEDLTARYGGLVALDGTALDVRAGEVHAVVGPNGSGKSTLLKVLAGETGSGTVLLRGTSLGDQGTGARARAGIVRTPQATALMANLAADRQVAVGRRGGAGRAGDVLRHLLRTPRSRRTGHEAVVAGSLALVGLSHVVGADPQLLGAGEQRLLQVARAAATGAGVLLLDEPAAGMSAPERALLSDAIGRLAAEGRAVVLVEHDLGVVAAVADRVTVLEAGRVLARGKVEQVLVDPEVRRAYLGGQVVRP